MQSAAPSVPAQGKLNSILMGLNLHHPLAPMSSQGLPLSRLQFLGLTDLGMALPNASQVNLQDASKLISSWQNLLSKPRLRERGRTVHVIMTRTADMCPGIVLGQRMHHHLLAPSELTPFPESLTPFHGRAGKGLNIPCTKHLSHMDLHCLTWLVCPTLVHGQKNGMS